MYDKVLHFLRRTGMSKYCICRLRAVKMQRIRKGKF